MTSSPTWVGKLRTGKIAAPISVYLTFTVVTNTHTLHAHTTRTHTKHADTRTRLSLAQKQQRRGTKQHAWLKA